MASSDFPARSTPSVLVVDDEPDLRTLYELSLAREGCEVVGANDISSALEILRHRTFDVVVSDMRLPDGLGLVVLQFLSDQRRSERCIVITAYGSAENAVEALKAGAFDYLTKPVDVKQFRSVVAQAVCLSQGAWSSGVEQASSNYKTTSSHRGLSNSSFAGEALQAIVGDSPMMVQLRERVSKVAQSMAPVLVRGESGTGKELVARAIHACSHRQNGPFVAVNCSAIPENLLEVEFFGARKGAYTGATSDREGFFQAANGGTLFLDEIGDLPLSMQAKLLRVIQERVVRPVGGTQESAVDARIVSATHLDLNAAVLSGGFRQDLFYRVNVIDIVVPSLRDRREDLPLLVEHLVRKITQLAGQKLPEVSSDFLLKLQSLPLKGNVRELENLLHRAIALSDPGMLSLDGVYPEQFEAGGSRTLEIAKLDNHSEDPLPRDLQAHLDEQERAILVRALKDCDFNRTLAADRLGISLRQIRYRMSRLRIDPNEIRR